MQVISKRKMTFMQFTIVGDGVTSDKHQHIQKSHTVNCDPVLPQTVPDWIKDDPLFDLAIQDGNLVVVVVEPIQEAVPTNDTVPATNDDSDVLSIASSSEASEGSAL